MRVIINVRSAGTVTGWQEEYDADALSDPSTTGRRRTKQMTVTTHAQAKEWAESIIGRYNDTMRPGDTARELVSVEFLPDQGAKP